MSFQKDLQVVYELGEASHPAGGLKQPEQRDQVVAVQLQALEVHLERLGVLEAMLVDHGQPAVGPPAVRFAPPGRLEELLSAVHLPLLKRQRAQADVGLCVFGGQGGGGPVMSLGLRTVSHGGVAVGQLLEYRVVVPCCFLAQRRRGGRAALGGTGGPRGWSAQRAVAAGQGLVQVRDRLLEFSHFVQQDPGAAQGVGVARFNQEAFSDGLEGSAIGDVRGGFPTAAAVAGCLRGFGHRLSCPFRARRRRGETPGVA